MKQETAEEMVSLLERIYFTLTEIKDSNNLIEDAVSELRMDISGFKHEGRQVPGALKTLDEISDAIDSLKIDVCGFEHEGRKYTGAAHTLDELRDSVQDHIAEKLDQLIEAVRELGANSPAS